MSIRAAPCPEKRAHLVLRGLDERKDSPSVVLDRAARKDTLSEATPVAG